MNKAFTTKLAVKHLEESGGFSGYASIFNVIDGQYDVMVKGAFERTLLDSDHGRKIKLLWQHKTDEPIGIIEHVHEDEKGLYIEAKLLLDVARAREAYQLLKSGAVDSMSIGYTVNEHEIENERGVRLLKSVNLLEISLVTFPANEFAKVVAVKSVPSTTREFEKFLRDAGYSRKQAKAISASGFSHDDFMRDAEMITNHDVVHCLDALDNAFDILTRP